MASDNAFFDTISRNPQEMEFKILVSIIFWVAALDLYDCQSQNDTEENRVYLKKRLMVGSAISWKLWPNATVPYCYDSDLPAFKYPIYTAAMHAYERHSCIAFKYYADCSPLSDGGIKLVPGGNPYSYIGYQWSLKSVTLTTRYDMVTHELFHVIGAYHEQQNYKSISKAEIMYYNIVPYYRAQFVPTFSEKDHLVDHDVITSYFDYNSPTLYSRYVTSYSGFPTYDVMYPDQYFIDEQRVFLDQTSSEISEYYNCWDLRSCGQRPTCELEGYPGYYDKQCGCVCPRGLESASGCTTIKTKPTSGSWPDTDLKILKTTSGCPAGMTESTAVVTGVAGLTTSSDYNLATSLSGDTLTIYTCSKTGAGNTQVWDHGMNGFLAENTQCPSDLESGTIEFYDSNDANVGSLKFCVQQGLVEEPLMGLPTSDEFAVFSRADTCQEVDGFVSSRESLTIKHPNAIVVSDVPKHTIVFNNGNFELTLTYCVYKPLTYNCGVVTKLTSTSNSIVIQSPNHPGAYPQNTECNWFIEVEEGARIKAEFLSFDIDNADTFSYRRYILNAIPAKLSNENSLPRNIVSIYNRMALHFRSGFVGNGGTGFQINITRLGAEDYCYSLSDKGESYDGDWNYAIDGTKCLPWNLRFDNNLTISGFADYVGSTSTFLTGSACRNPQGKLDKPACLTFVKGGNFSMRYCDVCQNEYGTTDIYDDCATAVSADPSICTGITAGKCLSTCEQNRLIPPIKTPLKVGERTCPTPPIPSDATQVPGTEKSSYHPGDAAQLNCTASGKLVNVTCTFSGRWSEWDELCKGCPAGFAEVNGKCWTVAGRLDNRYEAKQYCKYYYNAELMTIRTNTEHNFFYDWRTQLGDNMEWWMGGANWGSGWKWDDDGSLLSSYETSDMFGWPSDTNNEKYCLIHNIWLKWMSIQCTNQGHFICEKPLEGSPMTCTDRKQECSTLLKDNPLACTDPVVKTNVCPYTCGADVCLTSGKECSNIPTPANAAMVVTKTSLAPGDFVQYKCDSGYELMTGSLTRACLRTGELSGCSPVCVVSDSVVTSVNDFPMGMYRDVTTEGQTSTGESIQFAIDRNGHVYSWQVYCANDGEVWMQVWRLVSELKYELIGQTVITCYKGIARDVPLNSTERIAVQNGDRLGFFDSTGGVVTSYSCWESNMPEFSNVHVYLAWPYQMTVSSQFTFVGNMCHMYAVNAKIGP